MANIPIWPGSSSFTPGKTPFGFYDYDYQFQIDADKVSRFCAQRLGYPIEDIELQDINFYTAFEQAVTVYGNELYSYKLRDNYLSLEGANTSSNLNHAIVTPNLGNIIRTSEQYAAEAGAGGNLNWYSGSIVLTGSIQDYDLNQWALSQGISGSDLEIKRIFYTGRPASADYYYAGGIGLGGGLGGYFGNLGGVAGYGSGTNYLVTPISYNIQAIQTTEIARDVFYSAHSFEILNNKLRLFPVPTNEDSGLQLWFQYIKKSDRLNNSITQSPGQITNVANVNYTNPSYTQINSIGRSWIFEYTLALAKEMLGYVRGKYSSIPIPGESVTLNQQDLLSSADKEKETLVTKLRTYFDETSKKSLLERRKDESAAIQQELDNIPLPIFIG